MSFEKLGPFKKGPKNDAYAQYFVGQSYLNMLTTSGVVTANLVAATTGTFTTKADKFFWSQPAAGGIRNLAKKLENCTPAMSSTLRLKSNIGTVPPKTVGLNTSPLKCPLKVQKTNGVNLSATKNTKNFLNAIEKRRSPGVLTFGFSPQISLFPLYRQYRKQALYRFGDHPYQQLQSASCPRSPHHPF